MRGARPSRGCSCSAPGSPGPWDGASWCRPMPRSSRRCGQARAASRARRARRTRGASAAWQARRCRSAPSGRSMAGSGSCPWCCYLGTRNWASRPPQAVPACAQRVARRRRQRRPCTRHPGPGPWLLWVRLPDGGHPAAQGRYMRRAPPVARRCRRLPARPRAPLGRRPLWTLASGGYATRGARRTDAPPNRCSGETRRCAGAAKLGCHCRISSSSLAPRRRPRSDAQLACIVTCLCAY